MGHGKQSEEKKGWREQIELYYLQGYTVAAIAEKTGLKKQYVSADIKLIKRQMEPHKIWPVEYYRNKARRQIGMAASKAWEIYDGNKTNPSVALSALRVIKEFDKLLAEVDGIINEKMPTEAPKRAAGLLEEIKKIDAKAKVSGDNGHKEDAKEIIPSES